MKNNYTQNLQYDQFVPHRERHICCDEKNHLPTEVFAHGCSLCCKLHTIHRQSVLKCDNVSFGRNVIKYLNDIFV